MERGDFKGNIVKLPASFPGLSNVASEEAEQLASELAQRWIRSNWLAYTKHRAMFEKVTSPQRRAARTHVVQQ